MKKISFLITTLLLIFFTSCKKNTIETGPYVIFKFKFDSTQQRLNNFGNPSIIPVGNAAQSPIFNVMSAHYLELTLDSLTQIGNGKILYKAPETNIGGSNAIDFEKSIFAGNNEEFLKIPIKNITAGNYKWIRLSLAYQNYDIKIKYENSSFPSINGIYTGTVSSFVGFNTYIKNYTPKTQNISVNGNKKQGYWGGEVSVFGTYKTFEGQAPEGATTVPNPLAFSSPIPAGSCVVTGKFDNHLIITGNETNDITVTISLSTNKSFEWKDKNGDGLFQPTNASNTAIEDSVVDMGLRGLKTLVQY